MENLTCIYNNKDLMGVVNNIIRMKKNNSHPYFDFIEGFEYLTAQGYSFSDEVIDKIADLRVFVAGEKDYYEEILIIQKRYELKRKLTRGELLDLESGKNSIWNLDCFCEHSFEELSIETESQKIVTFNKESGFFETVMDY